MTDTIKNEGNSRKYNIAQELFGRIWAFWGLITFVVTFIIIFPVTMTSYLIKGNKGQYWFILVSRFWMTIWLFMVGCPIRVRGRKNFAKGKAYVIVCNHTSLIDPSATCPFIPGANKTIAKMSFAKVPIFGWFYRRGSVLVDRMDTKSRLKSFEEMKKVIEQNMHMLIYPEGTRNTTGEPLKAFYDGAFSLAVRTKSDIIPAVLTNTGKALPADKPFFFLPHLITLEFLPPVSSEGKDAKTLKEEVYNIMYKKIEG